MIVLLILGYAAVAVFVVGMAARAVHFANKPAHLRWELYPVPHEAPSRAKYGGSYMEEVDWWEKEHETSPIHELVDMFSEILLLKALWHHNRKLWFFSFPFHFGLYLLMTFVVVLIAAGILGALGVGVGFEDGALGMVVSGILGLLGFFGFGLGLLGVLGLLFRRLTDGELKDFTGPVDLMNLVWFILLFGAGLAMMALDPFAAELQAYFQGLVTGKVAEGVGIVTVVAMVLAIGMVIYIPFTHMSHMVAKYFTYHSVRWNDEALEPGNKLDQQIQEQLKMPVNWSAPHIQSEGSQQTWADVATKTPWDEEAAK